MSNLRGSYIKLDKRTFKCALQWLIGRAEVQAFSKSLSMFAESNIDARFVYAHLDDSGILRVVLDIPVSSRLLELDFEETMVVSNWRLEKREEVEISGIKYYADELYPLLGKLKPAKRDE